MAVVGRRLPFLFQVPRLAMCPLLFLHAPYTQVWEAFTKTEVHTETPVRLSEDQQCWFSYLCERWHSPDLWNFPVLTKTSDNDLLVVKSPIQPKAPPTPGLPDSQQSPSNKLLTLLKRWHFSSLFIKLPEEHLSWGANKRGTGEKCFSPGFPEPWNLPPRPLKHLLFPWAAPHKYQKNTIQQNGGPGRQIHAAWMFRPGSLKWLDVSE